MVIAGDDKGKTGKVLKVFPEKNRAIVEGRKPRVSADLCRHVTEGINAFNVSVETGKPYEMTTSFEMPEALAW